MEEIQFKQHFLYIATEDIEIAYKMDGKFMNKEITPIRKMIIPKGEILEFRYYSPAHFRDVFNHYFPVHESQTHKLKEIAEIYSNVAFDNRAELYDILRLALYKRTDGERATNLPIRPDSLKKHFEGVEYKNL